MKRLKEPSGKPLRIGVIEESSDNLYSIRFILQSLGYQAEAFPPGSGLVPALQAFQPDLLMVDMMMPGNQGLAVVRRLKASQARRFRILAVTAEAAAASDSEIRQAGAHDILHKPYTVSELQEKLVR